jgi:hypothetical protein
MLYVGDGESIAARFDEDAEVLDWVRSVSGRDLTLSQYLAESYPLAWRRQVLSVASDDPLSVIEAVSEGVIQNTLYGAAGDYLAALRPRVSSVVKARAIARAYSFLDLPYDFDFDFATDQSLVCSEVVWRAYRPSPGVPGLRLTPVTIAGRLTLPPNEILRKFAAEYGEEHSRFDFVDYLEGRDREGRAVPATVEELLATPHRSKWTY